MKTSSAALLNAATKKKKLCVVQFPHPKDEATPTRQQQKNSPIFYPWNCSGRHKRKFMKAVGQIVDSNNQLSAKQDLLFWGEWEPTSIAEQITQWSGNGVQPQWLHIPYLKIPNSIIPPGAQANGGAGGFPGEEEIYGAGANSCGGCSPQPGPNNYPNDLNTDPLVFGNYFIYSNCRQIKNYSGKLIPTQLAFLQQGSIILFGSKLTDTNGIPYFALDTVFVVGESRRYIPFNYNTNLKGFVPKAFPVIMGNFMSNKNCFTCYQGATFNQPVQGMFSFSPCKPYKGVNEGFPRVKLTDKDFAQFGNIIINGLSRNYHLTDIPNLDVSCMIWDKVCQIVQQQGYERGVNFENKRIP